MTFARNCDQMQYEEYKDLYNSLKGPADVERLSDRYDARMLDSLYTQKTSREVKKRFYTVKQNSKRMLNEWKKGKSIVELADKYRFPPILTAMFLFLENGTSKKTFWSVINNPDILECPDAAAEVREAISKDIVYSPAANDRQRERGLWGEDLLHQWLDGQGITYRTENDLRGTEYTKTASWTTPWSTRATRSTGSRARPRSATTPSSNSIPGSSSSPTRRYSDRDLSFTG